MPQISSVEIFAKGETLMRVIVPPFEPAGDDVVAEAMAMFQAMAKWSPDDLVARIHQTYDVTDVEKK